MNVEGKFSTKFKMKREDKKVLTNNDFMKTWYKIFGCCNQEGKWDSKKNILYVNFCAFGCVYKIKCSYLYFIFHLSIILFS